MDMTLPNRCVWKFPGWDAWKRESTDPRRPVTAGDCGQLGEKSQRASGKPEY